jgi:hypothetical protein
LYGNGFEMSAEMEMLSLGAHEESEAFCFGMIIVKVIAVLFFSMQK